MFKFYTIPDETTINKLIGHHASIKFSSAFNLNDPFELKFNFVLDPFADGQKVEYFKSNPLATSDDFKDWQRHVQQHQGYTWYAEQEQRKALSQLITLSSFTENNSNNLMWSHYAGNHKGICVEYFPELFDLFKSSRGFLIMDKVKYSDLPPIVDSLEEDRSKILKMVFNKQAEWQYENEYRVIFQSNNVVDYLPIDIKLIKAVYIGSGAGQEVIQRIHTVCKNSHIEIFYGITVGDSYQVRFQKHKEGTIYMKAFW